ncbi:hypothetical protein H1D32_08615 [Anaerobacillus sp. CMMVII]|uniref:small nuclear ribonucleoprotein n=1 Tax=Anaerobacillus sp. CMMVII TaxID=2755588 RepID=UPI0021B797B7|nr:small nuclear ribonucleoprotein [Anaerobacillus sp. CMMVII]MCT8137812.1 hypothetical protein [Anaerobacillus sp. CMMVII]
MDFIRQNYSHSQNLHEDCNKYMNYHCSFTLTDGNTFDGIIESVGPDRVTVLVGEDVMEENETQYDERQYYGGYGGYGRPRRRFRRFRRQTFPLASLAALALLPYIVPPQPYPYYYPYY